MSLNQLAIDAFNKFPSPSQDSKHLLGHTIGKAYAEYLVDATSQQNGSVGTHFLGLTLPKGAIVMQTIVDVETIPLDDAGGGTATLALTIGATNIIAAAAVSGAPWSTTGLKAGVQDDTVANAAKLSADSNVNAVVAVDNITAAKVKVYLEFLYPAP